MLYHRSCDSIDLLIHSHLLLTLCAERIFHSIHFTVLIELVLLPPFYILFSLFSHHLLMLVTISIQLEISGKLKTKEYPFSLSLIWRNSRVWETFHNLHIFMMCVRYGVTCYDVLNEWIEMEYSWVMCMKLYLENEFPIWKKKI